MPGVDIYIVIPNLVVAGGGDERVGFGVHHGDGSWACAL